MRIPQKITMREVARLAAVSPSTVSAVLNGNVLVSKERTLRVRNAIKALGFQAEPRSAEFEDWPNKHGLGHCSGY